MRIKIDTYESPQGYGFIRIFSTDLGDSSVVSFQYDLKTYALKKIGCISFTSQEVKPVLYQLIDEESGLMKTAFNLLGFSELSDEEIAQFKMKVDTIKKDDQESKYIIEKISSLPKVERYHSQINFDHSIYVSQGEYAAAKFETDLSHIRTSGLGPCVCLILYDAQSKSGALFHIDVVGRNNEKINFPIKDAVSSMEKMGAQKNSITAVILAGNESSPRETIVGIVKELPAEISIIGQDIEPNYSRPSSVVLDLNTGDVSSYLGYGDSDRSIDTKIRLLTSFKQSMMGDNLVRVWS